MPKAKTPWERNALACAPADQGVQLKGRLWLEKDGRTFLSWGRVALLEGIAREGSLSAAARNMGMSFSHAWNLVESMNCLAGQPLVEKQAGGQGGGGARLTEAGQRAIADFWRLVEEFQAWMNARRSQ
ncbi:MAG: LysR family transcriptional regulator [Pseudomonadota bacterium]